MTSCPAASSSMSTVRPRCSCQSRNVDDGCFSTVPGGVGVTGCVIKNYQPHGNLARILWEKQKADERLRTYDKSRVCIYLFIYLFIQTYDTEISMKINLMTLKLAVT